MNIDKLNHESIGRYIPNIVAEAKGETPLVDKLAPFIASVKMWLEREYLGSDDFLSDAHNELALKILVAKAFADAVPSLDLVVTPTGMAVINTDNLAPASKERVERLVSSMHGYVRTNLTLLIDICRTYKQWRDSERGMYYCSTFLSSISDIECVPDMKDTSYAYLRMRCMLVENELADRYIGRNLMTVIRDSYNSGAIAKHDRLVSVIRAADIHLLSDADKGVFDQNKLWHAARKILHELNYYPEFKELWQIEMGEKFKSLGFVNNIKGSFYF